MKIIGDCIVLPLVERNSFKQVKTFLVYLKKHLKIIFRNIVYVESVSKILYVLRVHSTKLCYVA